MLINTDDVVRKLKCYDVEVVASDITIIELAANSTEEYIKNFCNIKEIPTELYNTAVDMCCGIFLKTKTSIGTLNVIDASGDVASITEGDVSISFKNGTGSATIMQDTIKKLCNKDSELIVFRKLRW
ncbi:MAG: hypothetical protein ACI4VF_03560 [Lachnospirales bacterium]